MGGWPNWQWGCSCGVADIQGKAGLLSSLQVSSGGLCHCPGVSPCLDMATSSVDAAPWLGESSKAAAGAVEEQDLRQEKVFVHTNNVECSMKGLIPCSVC